MTGSGLSITKWEIITGTIPPLNSEDWQKAFEQYQKTPQYQKLNEGMPIKAFKKIYFWEYLHRLWARGMGFIFLLPLMFFLYKKWIDKQLLSRLVVVFLLAAGVASFGWIMVASGLISRPWVNAYKLSVHLCLALILYVYLMWLALKYAYPNYRISNGSKTLFCFLLLIGLQIGLGGLMSGMKAALVYPTFPDYSGSYIPRLLLDTDSWSVDNFYDYDRSAWMPALVQVLHRTLGYILFIIGCVLILRFRKHWWGLGIRWSPPFMFLLLITQIIVGIMVLIKSISEIPVVLGVMHQAVAILLLTIVVYLKYFDQPTDQFAGDRKEA